MDRTPLRSADYRLPARLARHVKARDQYCTFPDCRRLANDCDSDHLDPWPAGATCINNLASECRHHHLAKHGYFTVRRTPDGYLHWTSPHGLTVSRPPRALLRGW